MPLYLCSTTSKYGLIFYQKRRLSSIKPLSVSSLRLLHLLLPSLFLPFSFLLFLSFFNLLSPLSFFLSSPDLLSKILPLFFFPNPLPLFSFLSYLFYVFGSFFLYFFFVFFFFPIFLPFSAPPTSPYAISPKKKRPLPITASPHFSLFLIFFYFFIFFNVLLSSK